ncbi:hypothetical protein T12_13925 [Trichinella patagoniensis]|uniref:Uncharacterized protein n=1 Tax=Trichinella patagoniensis TaxID=990121 RepID=A0A0V0ZQU9_9BILA|nr:hypothetical protein T12_13925 [Trichinella patagoniensis]
MKLLTVKNSIAIARYSIQVICEFMKSLSTASIKHLFSCFSRERKQAIIKIEVLSKICQMSILYLNSVRSLLFVAIEIHFYMCYIMLLRSRKPAFQKCELIFTRLLLLWKSFYDQMLFWKIVTSSIAYNYHLEIMHTFCLNYTTYISDLLAFYTANKKDFPRPILNIKWRGCG